jgi:hypothetical protein
MRSILNFQLIEAFHDGLLQFSTYLTSLSSPSEFSGVKLIEVMDSFREPFNHHFHSEIASIAKLSEYGDYPEAGPIFAKWGKQSIMKSSYTVVIPFLFMNFDRTFEDGTWKDWPPMPVVIRIGLTRLGSAWHSG